MTWLIFALLSLLYLFVGAVIGYLAFGDDDDFVILVMIAWPIIAIVFTFICIGLGITKSARFVVDNIRSLIDILGKMKWRSRGKDNEDGEEKEE